MLLVDKDLREQFIICFWKSALSRLFIAPNAMKFKDEIQELCYSQGNRSNILPIWIMNAIQMPASLSPEVVAL
jgi:hypothetical protein